MNRDFSQVPIIDIGALVGGTGDLRAVADTIGRACRECGFFYVVGHGVDTALQARLEALAKQFFAQPEARKREIEMARGGPAWRGWFPVGAELTSGKPDCKEGIYFGAELGDENALVRAGTPLHGPNLFPDLPGFRETVLAWMAAMTQLGHALMGGIALSLDLPASWFAERFTGDPLTLFRIFHYPGIQQGEGDAPWSVGEHTDYGVLTILLQDEVGGLQVRSRDRWIDATPVPGSFVCNLGDMLDRMTGGRYRSTPHRVRNAWPEGPGPPVIRPARHDRLSFPFFFDPHWNAEVGPIPGCAPTRDDKSERWDGASVHEWRGTYGDYLLAKVSKVFPQLKRAVL